MPIDRKKPLINNVFSAYLKVIGLLITGTQHQSARGAFYNFYSDNFRNDIYEKVVKEFQSSSDSLKDIVKRVANSIGIQDTFVRHFKRFVKNEKKKKKEVKWVITRNQNLQNLMDTIETDSDEEKEEKEEKDEKEVDLTDVESKIQVFENEQPIVFSFNEAREQDEELINRLSGFINTRGNFGNYREVLRHVLHSIRMDIRNNRTINRRTINDSIHKVIDVLNKNDKGGRIKHDDQTLIDNVNSLIQGYVNSFGQSSSSSSSSSGINTTPLPPPTPPLPPPTPPPVDRPADTPNEDQIITGMRERVNQALGEQKNEDIDEDIDEEKKEEIIKKLIKLGIPAGIIGGLLKFTKDNDSEIEPSNTITKTETKEDKKDKSETNTTIDYENQNIQREGLLRPTFITAGDRHFYKSPEQLSIEQQIYDSYNENEMLTDTYYTNDHKMFKFGGDLYKNNREIHRGEGLINNQAQFYKHYSNEQYNKTFLKQNIADEVRRQLLVSKQRVKTDDMPKDILKRNINQYPVNLTNINMDQTQAYPLHSGRVNQYEKLPKYIRLRR